MIEQTRKQVILLEQKIENALDSVDEKVGGLYSAMDKKLQHISKQVDGKIQACQHRLEQSMHGGGGNQRNFQTEVSFGEQKTMQEQIERLEQFMHRAARGQSQNKYADANYGAMAMDGPQDFDQRIDYITNDLQNMQVKVKMLETQLANFMKENIQNDREQ